MMEVIRWYVLARLSHVAMVLGREADGSPPKDRVVCETWFALSDAAWYSLAME